MRPLLPVLLAVLSAAPSVQADKIDDIIKDYMTASNTPGMSVLVLKNGKIIKSKGYGFANLELSAKAKPETVYEIGSVTKMFTAVLVLLLAEEGKLNLDDAVSKYLSDIPDTWKPATLRQCLSHTAGIPDYLARPMNQRLDYSKEDILKGIATVKMDFAFGASWSYSNTGFYLAGMVLEKVTGKEYADLLQERILTPLDMKDTALYRPARLYMNRASGYIATDKRVMNAEVIRPNSGYAAGSIVSTTSDLAKWVQGLTNGKLLKPESLKAMWTPISLTTGRTYPYGLGWDVATLSNGSQYIGHGGNTYGYSAWLSMFPNEKLCVVTLCNNAGQSTKGLNAMIARSVAASVKPVETKGGGDPSPTRTQDLRRAIASLIRGTPDPDYIDPEMLGMLSSVRGRVMMTTLNAALGKIQTLDFIAQQPEGQDWNVWCSAKFEKSASKIELRLLVSKDGKLVRLDTN